MKTLSMKLKVILDHYYVIGGAISNTKSPCQMITGYFVEHHTENSTIFKDFVGLEP